MDDAPGVVMGARPDVRTSAGPLRTRGVALAFAFLALAAPASAQQPIAGTVTLTGVVLDGTSGARVPGALLALGERGPRTLSDSLGAFSLSGVPTGPQRLVVQRFGYVELDVQLTVTTPPDPLELRLDPDPVALEELAVTGGARVALTGVVLDAGTGEPLPWASMWLRDERRASADERGVFRIPDVPTGGHLLLVERLGYESRYFPVAVMAPPLPVELRLEPDSAYQAGLAQMDRQLLTRRRSSRMSVRAYGEEDLRRSVSAGLRQFLEYDSSLSFVPCPSLGSFTDFCVRERGRAVEPRVCIDGRAAWGVEELGDYRPDELYLVEIYNRGVVIEAFTYRYMERVGRNPRVLLTSCRGHPAAG